MFPTNAAYFLLIVRCVNFPFSSYLSFAELLEWLGALYFSYMTTVVAGKKKVLELSWSVREISFVDVDILLTTSFVVHNMLQVVLLPGC